MTETILTPSRKAGCPTFCALPELQADLQTRTLNCKQSTIQRTSTDFKPPPHLFRYLWLCDFPKCHFLYSLKQQKLLSAYKTSPVLNTTAFSTHHTPQKRIKINQNCTDILTSKGHAFQSVF